MQVAVTLDYNQVTSPATYRAARTAFGDNIVFSLDQVVRGRSRQVRILATAEQLVAFQVAREELGGQNLWKALKVKILRPEIKSNGQTIYYDAIRGVRVDVR